ncbi:MAG: ribonuclease HII [Thermoplasmatales archaeon]|nr:MAG: ribonuclease HII [Thermoplasmatales archaeon]
MITGVDEAGRGPVIGPLVIAGVTFKDENPLIELNVRDSKKIFPNRRKFLAEKIKQIALNYEILIIKAKEIDDMRKVMTLNEIEVNAFTKVIKKLKPELCYVDSADVNENRFKQDILSQLTFKTEIISKHKADDLYPIVGAASIIAKTKRDEEVNIIEEELKEKLNIPLGSGYPADPITQKFLQTWLVKYKKLPPYIRKSWKTSQNLLKNSYTKKLEDY